MEFDDKSDILIRSLVNQILDAVSASIIYVPLINHFGKKKVAFGNLLLDGILFLLLALLLHLLVNNNIATIILFYIARFIIFGQLTLLHIYTAEQFPTYIRCSCFGIVNAIGRIRSILCVNLYFDVNNLPLTIILLITGASSIIISPFIVYLEETHHKELDEMIENDNRELLLEY